jgi:hypothetical protein
MIRRNQPARAGHVVNDNGGFAGNMIAEMAGNKACVGIVPATWRGSNDDPDCFPFIERRRAMSALVIDTQRNQQNSASGR